MYKLEKIFDFNTMDNYKIKAILEGKHDNSIKIKKIILPKWMTVNQM